VPPDEGGGGLTPSGSEGLSGNGCITSGGSAEGLFALGCAEGVNVVTGRSCSPVAAFSKIRYKWVQMFPGMDTREIAYGQTAFYTTWAVVKSIGYCPWNDADKFATEWIVTIGRL
jgi:hypothetical protein